MNRLILFTVFGTALTVGNVSQAAVTLSNTITDGANQYKDNSRDVLVDRATDTNQFLDDGVTPNPNYNPAGVLGVGDILYGFAKIDEKTFQDVGTVPTLEAFVDYIIFSQTVTAINTTTGVVTFGATADATYSLAALTGIGSISTNATIALFEKNVAGGFGNQVPVGNVYQTITNITGGTYLLSAGISTDDGSTDFLQAKVASLSTSSFAPLGAGIGTFSAGLSVLSQPGLPSVIFLPTTLAVDQNSVGSFHQISVSSGNIEGLNLVPNAVHTYVPADKTSGLAVTNPYSYSDNLNVTFNTIVTPEASSLCIWGIGTALCGVYAMRGRKKSITDKAISAS